VAEPQVWGPKRSAGYDDRVRRLFPGYEAMHARVVAELRARAEPGARVLVIGAGTGYEAVELARAGYHVVAVDPSEDMLTVARERAAGAPNLEFFRGRLEELPHRKRFDAALCLLVMHFLPDDGAKAALLAEARSRCSQAAALLLADLVGEPGTAGFEAAFEAWMTRLATVSTPEELGRDRERILADVHFISEARELELLRSNGWSNPAVMWRNEMMALFGAVG